MIRILIQGIGLFILLMISSCRNNHTEDRTISYETEDQSMNKKNSVPVSVSAMELCAHFNTNVGMAITRYKDYFLILSGKADQVEIEPVDNNCRKIIMRCQYTDSRDTGSLSIVIKQCIRDEVTIDTIVPGEEISMQCRLIEYRDRVIYLEEVVAPKN